MNAEPGPSRSIPVPASPPRLVPSPWPRLIVLGIFATAMGWLEAVVVVYIRGVIQLPRDAGMPRSTEVMRLIESVPWLLGTEQSREMATIAMLAAVAWLAASRWRQRFGAFIIIFGVWDITYYLGLYALLRWPPSLFTMDLLFLVPPHPWWYQPVWVPVAISVVMIMTGYRLFRETPRHH